MASTLTLSSVSPLCTEELLRLAVARIHASKHPDNGDTPPPIVNYTVRLASEKGNGYMGVIYRITVELQGGEVIRLIGKGMPENLTRRKLFKCEFFFSKEVHFYNKVAPAFRAFEIKHRGREAYEREPLFVAPDCYYAMSDGDNDFLLLEDIGEKGFKTLDRTLGLTIQQTLTIIQILARFHAISFAMKVLEPETFLPIATTGTVEPLFHVDEEERLGDYFCNVAQIFIRAAEERIGDTEEMKKFKTFCDRKVMFKRLIKILEEEDPLAVINHGDAWSTNFMLKDNGEARAIDFQLLRHCSALVDLSMLVLACTSEEQRVEAGGVDGILELYHRSVERACQELGVKNAGGMTLEKVKAAWRKYGTVAMGMVVELVQLSFMDTDDVSDLDRVDVGGEIDLVELTEFKEITREDVKKRIADLILLTVNEGMI